MSTTEIPVEVARLHLNVGAILVGTFLALIIYGFTGYLTYRYYRNYGNDGKRFKFLVGALFTIDTLQSIFAMHLCYFYLVIHYNDPPALKKIVWSFQTSLLASSLAPVFSNGFFLSRLYKIGQRNPLLIGGLSLLVLSRLALEFTFAVLSFIYPEFALLKRYVYLVKAFCSISSATDLLLAILICWYLHARRTGYERTDATIDLVITYTFSTGALTGIVCFISLITLLLINGIVDIAVHAILGKLYVNSVLVVLNSRATHRTPDGKLAEASTFGVENYSEKRSVASDPRSTSFTTRSSFTMGRPFSAIAPHEEGAAGIPLIHYRDPSRSEYSGQNLYAKDVTTRLPS